MTQVVVQRPLSRRELLAERIAELLDVPVTIAGVVLVGLLVADNLTPRGTLLATILAILSWTLWGLFVVEFLARLVVARSTTGFLRRNWWQLVFLVVPFLRFLRAFGRGSRIARATSTTVRSSRTAGRALAGRLGLLAGVVLGTVLVAAELLFTYSEPTYARALHAAALGAMTGEPFERDWGALGEVLEVALALHAALIFASLAGALGAYFLEQRTIERAERATDTQVMPATTPPD